ncbi:MAG: hypothetical protein ACYTG1_08785 [Planctomycetota bacterium]|jgi:hypothetical protein
MRGPRSILVLSAAILAGGCAAKPAPTAPPPLVIDAGRYDEAFDAAAEAARREGLVTAVRDRRGGVIVTEPRIASSLATPWGTHGEPFGQTLENTLVFQRRRARFDFTPRGADALGLPSPDDRIGEADLIALDAPPLDLTAVTGALELQVRVVLERAYKPGLRPDTWTRSMSTRTEIIEPGPDGQPKALENFWIPVTRDLAAETRLLAAVERALAPDEEDVAVEDAEDADPDAADATPE